MIDYKEMEQVIKDLNAYVNNLQKTTETQRIMGETIEALIRVEEQINQSKSSLENYTRAVEGLESEHKVITSQFDKVLQDYKKLHSAFELLDIELKKLHSQNGDVEKSLAEIQSAISDISSKIAKQNEFANVVVKETKANIENSTKELIEAQSHNLQESQKFQEGVINGAVKNLKDSQDKQTQGVLDAVAESTEKIETKTVAEIQKIYKGIKAELEVVKENQKIIINQQYENNKKTNIGFCIVSVLVGICLMILLFIVFK